jgi:hypothetical protein
MGAVRRVGLSRGLKGQEAAVMDNIEWAQPPIGRPHFLWVGGSSQP